MLINIKNSIKVYKYYWYWKESYNDKINYQVYKVAYEISFDVYLFLLKLGRN